MKLSKIGMLALILIATPKLTHTMGDGDYQIRKNSYEISLKLQTAAAKGDFNEVKTIVKDHFYDFYLKNPHYGFLEPVIHTAEKSGNKDIAPFLKDWAQGKLKIENLNIDQPGKQAQPGEQQPYPGWGF